MHFKCAVQVSFYKKKYKYSKQIDIKVCTIRQAAIGFSTVSKLIIITNSPANALHQRREFIKHFKTLMQVTLVSPKARTLQSEESLKGLKFVDLPFSRSGTSIFRELKVLLTLYKTLKSEATKDTIVHSFTLKPILYTNLLNKVFFKGRIQSFSTFTGLGYLFSEHSKKNLLQKLISKMLSCCLYTNSQRVIFQNDDDQQNFINKKIISKDSHVILGSGVDTDSFSYSSKEKGKPMIFLFIGRLLKDKGIVELINAFKKVNEMDISDIKLQIAGDYDFENPQSISKADFNCIKMDDYIEHLGFVEDIRIAIKKADVVVLPSYREGLPLSLIQACSMGKPILTTNAPGCRQIVDQDQNGFKVNAESAEALTNAILDFTKMPAGKLKEMGRYSRSKAESTFSSAVINSKIEALYSLT